MSDRMSIIKNAPSIRLPLVLRHDLGFDLARSHDGLDYRVFFQFQDFRHRFFKQRKKRFIRDDAVFDDFGQSGYPLAAR